MPLPSVSRVPFLALSFLVFASACNKPVPPPEPIPHVARTSAPAATPGPSALPSTGLVAPDQVLTLTQKVNGPLLLDVRTPEEYAAGHVPGALNVPVDDLAARTKELDAYRERGVITYCEVGARASKALDTLKSAGFTNLAQLDGSMQRWRDEKRPVEAATPAAPRPATGSGG